MTVPTKYAGRYIPVKYFLSAYRALSDGRRGIRHLDDQVKQATFLLSEWKVIWIGTCAVLRTAIDLFQVDAKSCLSPAIRHEIANEWKAIKDHREDHAIFWEFLRQERNNIIHEYQWRAYEAWIKADGTVHNGGLSLLALAGDDAKLVLLMRGGRFEGRNSLELLMEGADWVEARIFGAIRRAGFDPEERRGLVNFQSPPTLKGGGLLGDLSSEGT